MDVPIESSDRFRECSSQDIVCSLPKYLSRAEVFSYGYEIPASAETPLEGDLRRAQCSAS
jgi:hypothetical protein